MCYGAPFCQMSRAGPDREIRVHNQVVRRKKLTSPTYTRAHCILQIKRSGRVSLIERNPPASESSQVLGYSAASIRLFVHPATSCPSPTPSARRRFLLTCQAGRDGTVRAGGWSSCTRGHNPELHLQFGAATTVNRYQSTRIDAARVDQIVLGAIGTCLCLTFAR